MSVPVSRLSSALFFSSIKKQITHNPLTYLFFSPKEFRNSLRTTPLSCFSIEKVKDKNYLPLFKLFSYLVYGLLNKKSLQPTRLVELEEEEDANPQDYHIGCKYFDQTMYENAYYYLLLYVNPINERNGIFVEDINDSNLSLSFAVQTPKYKEALYKISLSLFHMAYTKEGENNLWLAFQYLTVALALDPISSDLLLLRGKTILRYAYITYSREFYRRAEIDFKKALENNPHDVEALSSLGWVYLRQKKYQQALLYFQQVLKKDRNHLTTLVGLGKILLKYNFVQEAIACFEEVLKINPEQPEAQLGLGSAYLAQRDYERSIAYLTQISHEDWKGEQQKEITKAYQQVKPEICENFPYKGYLAFFEASRLLKEQKYQQALDSLQQLEKNFKEMQVPIRIIGKCRILRKLAEGFNHFDKQEYDLALKVFNKILGIDTHNVRAVLGIVLINQRPSFFS